MSGVKRLIVLGTGSIAHRHAENFSVLPGIELVAAVDTNLERARAFADRHGIAQAFGDLDEALAAGGFVAAVNSTPDAVHKPTTLKLIGAGKDVFCEKPLALNFADAMEMTQAAEDAGLINMVNLTYRNAHAIQMARRMIAAGEIGEVRHAERHDAQTYYDMLAAHARELDIWRTTYFHVLENAAAVVEWFKSTALLPFLQPLEAEQQVAFLQRYQAAIAEAYPAQADGRVLLPFPRLFLVARR